MNNNENKKKYVEVKAFTSISTNFMIEDYFFNKLKQIQTTDNNQVQKQ